MASDIVRMMDYEDGVFVIWLLIQSDRLCILAFTASLLHLSLVYCHFLASASLYKIKSLLLSHHHSTSALVSEILMSVLQTVQKKTTTIYIWTDSAKKQQQFTYGQTVQKNNKQFTYGQTVQKSCTGAFTVLQTVQKNNNNNLHMDSTYLQTVQKTMCKIHIHILSTHSVL